MSANGLSFLEEIKRPALIGMIHVGALPGTPRSRQHVGELAREAVGEAAILVAGGVDAIMLENMHDVPYLNRRVGPEIVAAMTAICSAVREAVSLPLGVQVLAGANCEAVAAAHASGCQFVRCEGFVFSHVADEGLMPDADAGPLLRFRRMIGAEDVAIIADVKKKHSSHAITADVSLAETAKAAVFFGADGVVVTGTATGEPTSQEDVAAVAGAVDQAVFVGSGVRPDNVAMVAPYADALIVGSYLKREGYWENEPDPARVAAMVKAVHGCVRAAGRT
ncbi:MAG TPA: BtpA/SgcQ family protein [Phycisphaerae bacterium]|nr:BtpA/SgcQ family protein [Phycisphaerae bacterium]